MDQIIDNLATPSWWFTGLFFIVVGILIGYMAKGAPKWYRTVSESVPSVTRSYARSRRLKRLREIQKLRFHPLLVIREIVKLYFMATVAMLAMVIAAILYASTPGKENIPAYSLTLKFLPYLIPIYFFQIWTMSHKNFVEELLRSCKKVGTTRMSIPLRQLASRRRKRR